MKLLVRASFPLLFPGHIVYSSALFFLSVCLQNPAGRTHCFDSFIRYSLWVLEVMERPLFPRIKIYERFPTKETSRLTQVPGLSWTLGETTPFL